MEQFYQYESFILSLQHIEVCVKHNTEVKHYFLITYFQALFLYFSRPQKGLFEDINEGLRHAKVLIACVSDEYAKSANCCMELRFAADVMKLPTVLAVVGTGNQWRKSTVSSQILVHDHAFKCLL